MIDEIQTVIKTANNVRISVDEHDDGVWLSLQFRGADVYTTMSLEEAEQMIVGLQAILLAKQPA
jgi:hypothetical protein